MWGSVWQYTALGGSGGQVDRLCRYRLSGLATMFTGGGDEGVGTAKECYCGNEIFPTDDLFKYVPVGGEDLASSGGAAGGSSSSGGGGPGVGPGHGGASAGEGTDAAYHAGMRRANNLWDAAHATPHTAPAETDPVVHAHGTGPVSAGAVWGGAGAMSSLLDEMLLSSSPNDPPHAHDEAPSAQSQHAGPGGSPSFSPSGQESSRKLALLETLHHALQHGTTDEASASSTRTLLGEIFTTVTQSIWNALDVGYLRTRALTYVECMKTGTPKKPQIWIRSNEDFVYADRFTVCWDGNRLAYPHRIGFGRRFQVSVIVGSAQSIV